LNHGIIDQAQYSYLVAAVVGSAVIPYYDRNALIHSKSLAAEVNRGKGCSVS
jgi:hypothetical protein